MTRFQEFADSPYFNKHKMLRKLVAYLSIIFPDFSEKKCDRAVLFQHLFPKQRHDQKELALLFTYAMKLIEQFLIHEEFKEKEEQQKILLLAQLREKGQLKHYEKILKAGEHLLEKMPYKDSEHYNLQFELATERDLYYREKFNHKKDLSLQLKQDNLDFFFLSQKLKDACEMSMRRNILKVEYTATFIDAVVDEVAQSLERYKEVPSIVVYYYIYKMMENKATSFYFEALSILEQNEGFLPRNELIVIYNYLRHYCIEKINKGDNEFLTTFFELYKIQLKKGLLFENGTLSEWHYKNIATAGLRLNELDWVKQFIENYKVKLETEVAENAYSFNLASYYYSAQEYEKVRGLLLQVEYTDLRYSQGAKALLLRTYYDLDEYEAFISLADSFKQYLQRNKLISDSRRKGFYNLIRFAKRAFQIKNNIDIYTKEKIQKEVARLKKEIASSDSIFNQSWLDKKVANLE